MFSCDIYLMYHFSKVQMTELAKLATYYRSQRSTGFAVIKVTYKIIMNSLIVYMGIGMKWPYAFLLALSVCFVITRKVRR